MKVFWGLGRLLSLLFWLVVLVNLVVPFVHPLHLLVNLAGVSLLAIHLLELLFFRARFRGRPAPGRDRLRVLLFGIFHLQTLPTAPEASHA
jgi:putative membrane protein